MSWIRATLGDITGGRVLHVATGRGRFLDDLRFQLSAWGSLAPDSAL